MQGSRATPVGQRAAEPASPSRFRLGYRPCLDGLRGVSILAVMSLHARMFVGRAAFIGVVTFFVLSGFLITCLLIEEWDRRGTLSLKRFYLRRVLRLLPALTVMLVTFVVYQWVSGPRADAVTATKDALQALFYCRNWAMALAPTFEPGLFGHTWSLSIEEQFYLLWPPALLLLLRRASGRRSILWWVLLAVFLSAFGRFAFAFIGMTYTRIEFGTDTRCDALLLGCAAGIALCLGLIPAGRWMERLTAGLGYASVLGLIWLTVGVPSGFESEVSLVYFLIPLLAVLVIMQAVRPQSLLGGVLSATWLVYIGKISYGLYLWHLPIFLHVQARHWPKPKELAVEYALTAAAVLASYYLLERPILAVKQKLASSPHGNSQS